MWAERSMERSAAGSLSLRAEPEVSKNFVREFCVNQS